MSENSFCFSLIARLFPVSSCSIRINLLINSSILLNLDFSSLCFNLGLDRVGLFF